MNPDSSRVALYKPATDPTELDNRSREYPQVAQDVCRQELLQSAGE